MNLEKAQEVYRSLAEQKDQETVVEALRALLGHWATLTQVGMSGAMGAPDWTSGEGRIWDAGEGVRQLMRARKWKGPGPLLDLVAEVSADPKFGKGRQTFVLLLGDFGKGSYASRLGPLLEDPEVQGHAMDSLRKAKVGGFAEQASRLAAETKGWIRQSARKYLKDFGGPQSAYIQP